MPAKPRLTFLAIILLSFTPRAHAADRPLRQTIDAHIKSAWGKNKIVPAGRSSDAVFHRRLHLDLVGMIPTHDETIAFLKDADPQKRQKLIDRLLDDPRFASHQANVWDLLLFGRNPPGFEATRKRDGFKKWLSDQFVRNEPYDRWVKHLLQAEQDGSQLFYVQFRNQPEETTVAVSRIFLGIQLQCARCHDHPFESWTQKDFYGMAGFFVRLVVVDGEGGAKPGMKKFKIGEKSTGDVLFTGSVKEQKPGQKGEPVRPRYLGGQELDEPAVPKGFKEPLLKGNALPPRPTFSRKEKLVAWLTAADNPYLARAVANRVWAQFMGRGLVDPVDDLGGKHEPSHPELLKALTADIVERKFDLKGCIRELVSSDTYQLADVSAPLAAGKDPSSEDALPAWFERARVRPLSAEELMASLKIASGDPASAKIINESTEYFLRYFGEPTDGQGRFQGSLAEHLFLNNAGQIRTLAQPRKGNLGDALLNGKGSWEEKVERLFVTVLSRPPSEVERRRFAQHLGGDAKMTAARVEEAIWVLMSCAEFRFNR